MTKPCFNINYPCFSFSCTSSTNLRYTTCASYAFSRRTLLAGLIKVPLPVLSWVTERSHSDSKSSLLRATIAALRRDCGPFLSKVAPLSKETLLWRGHYTQYTLPILASPRSDLTDDATYGTTGATFFRHLDVIMTEQADKNSLVPRPCFSHIGTGSSANAAEWGFPLTVWPCGSIKCAVRKNGGPIYAQGDTLTSAALSRGPLVYAGLRDALRRGDEVMFQCHSFYILPSDYLSDVVDNLHHAPTVT